MPPPAPRPPRSPRQFGFRPRTLLGPVVPRERSEGFTRLPHCRVRMSLTADPVTAWHIRLDSPPSPEMRQRGQSVPAGASPRTIPECTTIRETAPERRLPQATAAAPVPGFCRLSGFPVCRSALRRRHHTAASKPLDCTAGTKAAPGPRVYQPCRRCAPRGLSAPSVRDSRHHFSPRVVASRRPRHAGVGQAEWRPLLSAARRSRFPGASLGFREIVPAPNARMQAERHRPRGDIPRRSDVVSLSLVGLRMAVEATVVSPSRRRLETNSMVEEAKSLHPGAEA